MLVLNHTDYIHQAQRYEPAYKNISPSLSLSHPAFMEEEVAKTLNETFVDIVSNRRGYKAVYALLVYWADADDPKIILEVDAVGSLFEEKFGFVVSKYAIPSDRAGPNLQMTLTTLTLQHDSKNDLLIFYYAGHGDANPETRRAIWAA
jgi:hypothetical protein